MLGYQKRKHKDWFDENNLELQQLIDKKRNAFLQLKQDPNSTVKKTRYMEIRGTLQKRVREIKIAVVEGEG